MDAITIINNTADAIKKALPIEEETLVNTKQLEATVRLWKEKESNLNLLQLAVIYGRVKIAWLLHNRYKFHYEKVKRYCKRFSWEHRPNTSEYMSVVVNSPLHLACKMGNLQLIKMFLSGFNGHKYNDALEQRSVLELDNVFAVHGNLIKHGGIEHKIQNSNMFQENESEVERYDEIEDSEILNNTSFMEDSESEILSSIICNIRRMKEAKTAFEICLQERHLECCVYIAELLFLFKIQNNVEFKYYFCQFAEFPNLPLGNALHIACYLKRPSYLKLLLENDYYKSKINTRDRSRKPPIWIALTSKDCVQVLLQSGADAGVIVNHRSLIQWLLVDFDCFYTVRNAQRVYGTMRLLLEFGANANWLTHPFHYQNQPTKKQTALEKLLKKFVPNVDNSKLKFKASYIMDCIRLLLDNGAETLVKFDHSKTSEKNAADKRKTRNNEVDYCEDKSHNISVCHTVLHTYLYDFFSDTPRIVFKKYPNLVCSLLQVLLEDGGLDANVVPTDSCMYPLITVLIIKFMFRWSPRNKRHLLHLLFINGADFDIVPRPHFMTSFGLGWRELPVVIAFIKNYHWSVVQNILDFMDVGVVKQTWPKLKMRKKNSNLITWNVLLRNYGVRKLDHLCKLVILRCLGKQAKAKIHHLFIPDILKMYLASNIF